jgi:chromosome segregation ATPase
LNAAQDSVRGLQSRIDLTEKRLAEEETKRQAQNLENKLKLEIAGLQWKELSEQHRATQQQLEQGRELETQLRTELAALHQDLGAALELQQELQASLENANQTLKREEIRIANERQECERRIQVAEERLAEEQTGAKAAHQEAATAREELNSIWSQIESLSQARNRAAAERDRFKKACEDVQAGQQPALERLEADLEKERGEHRAALAQVAELTDQLAELRQRVEQPKLRNSRK